jgi:hypothetical protein
LVCLEAAGADQETAMTSRKKSGVAFWATVGLVVVLVGYPLSVGPASYMAYHGWLGYGWQFTAYQSFYSPIFSSLADGPKPIQAAILWYLSLWIPIY